MKIDLGMTFSPVELARSYWTADTHISHPNIIEHCKRPVKDIEEMNEWIVREWNAVVPEFVGARQRTRPIVFHLGDVIFGREGTNWTRASAEEWLGRLHGEIILVLGNHDRQTEIWKWSTRFKEVFNQLELKFRDPEVSAHDGLDATHKHRMFMDHYRQATWNGVGRGTWHLYGHSHGGNMVWPTLAEIEQLRTEVYNAMSGNYRPEHDAQSAASLAILDRAEKAHRMRALDVGWDPWHRPLSYAEIRTEMLARTFFKYGEDGGEGNAE